LRAQIPSVKPSANGFFVLPTDIAMEWGITDERKADERNPSGMTSEINHRRTANHTPMEYVRR
jgi:hypothetical protein